jgi:hypothetical protein
VNQANPATGIIQARYFTTTLITSKMPDVGYAFYFKQQKDGEWYRGILG